MSTDDPRAWLMSKSFDANDLRKKTGKLKETAMHKACEKGNLYMCHWLYDNGAAPDIRAKNDSGSTPMMYGDKFNLNDEAVF